MLAAVLIGIAVRAWFVFIVDPHAWNYEMENVARALAAGRGWADVFHRGSGPTAHVLPVAPLVGATTYAVFGNGVTGHILRFGWAMLVTFGAYLLAARVMWQAGAPRRAVLSGLVVLCVLPLRLRTEGIYWQLWDGGLASVFAFAALSLVIDMATGRSSRSTVAAAGALAGAAFVVNPMLGLAIVALLALQLLRARDWRGTVTAGAAVAVVVAAVLVPWTLRNERVMGAPITLRDNLGLELAAANYPEAVAFIGEEDNLAARLTAMHPGQRRGFAALRAAGGEVAYSQHLLAETRAWIAANPGSTAIIWARHAREMVLTPTWIFRTEGLGRFAGASAMAEALFAALAVLALALAAWRRDRRHLYPALFILILVGLGLPFQTTNRYSWPIYPLVMLLMADGAGRLGSIGRIASERLVKRTGSNHIALLDTPVGPERR